MVDSESIQDGFDLIEYPCVYKFKAVCNSSDEVDERVRDIVAEVLSDDAIKGVEERESKKGKFVSITIQAELTNREQLEAVYIALKASENVLMTL